MKMKIGKETIQGYTRVVSGVSMTDCYSYGYSALIALEFLRLNKSPTVGRHMGFCLSGLRQLLFAKIKRDGNRGDRLPLGTAQWPGGGDMDLDILEHPELARSLGPLTDLLTIWRRNIDSGLKKKA